MTKIVINVCFGGFSLSDVAIVRYSELKGLNLKQTKDKRGWKYWEWPNGDYFDTGSIERDDPALVQVVEELGKLDAGDLGSELHIVELPKGTRYRIEEYDGRESVRTFDQYEWRVA